MTNTKESPRHGDGSGHIEKADLKSSTALSQRQRIIPDAGKENPQTATSGLGENVSKCYGNSASSQRQRLLIALKERREGLTTIEIRKPPLDIMQPAARVHELKHKYGQPIITMDDWQETEAGKLHRVGRYVLIASPANTGV